jgi:hypothetical protein
MIRYLLRRLAPPAALALALAGCAGEAPVAPTPADKPRTVVIGDPRSGSWTQSGYTAFRRDLTAVVRVGFYDGNRNIVYGCTGTYLRLGKEVAVLAPARCLEEGSRFPGVQFGVVTAYRAPGVAEYRKVMQVHVHPWYSPTLNGEHNVGLAIIDSPFSTDVTRLPLSNKEAHVDVRLTVAGYGATGNSVSGAVFQTTNVLQPLPQLRYGLQRLETTCDDSWNCGTTSEPRGDQLAKGALLLGDFDRPGLSATTNFLCATLGHCEAGLKGEAMPASLGGEGSPAIADIYVVGIYLAGTLPVGAGPLAPSGLFDTFHTFACVSDWGVNQGCRDNHAWIVATAP